MVVTIFARFKKFVIISISFLSNANWLLLKNLHQFFLKTFNEQVVADFLKNKLLKFSII